MENLETKVLFDVEGYYVKPRQDPRIKVENLEREWKLWHRVKSQEDAVRYLLTARKNLCDKNPDGFSDVRAVRVIEVREILTL